MKLARYYQSLLDSGRFESRAALVAERNRIEAKIVWSFRVADARKKLDFLYPKELVR